MTEKTTRYKTKSPGRGGARPGGGRPKGSKNKIDRATVQTILEKLYDQTGRVYEDLLLEDFLNARSRDSNLAMKYHQLLANKLMPDLNQVEVKDSADTVEAKQQAFIEAVARLTGDSSTK